MNSNQLIHVYPIVLECKEAQSKTQERCILFTVSLFKQTDQWFSNKNSSTFNNTMVENAQKNLKRKTIFCK